MRRSALLLLATTGCAVLDDLRPRVSFEEIEVTSVDFSALGADFVFAVRNPNPLAVEVGRVEYELTVAGLPFLAGDLDEGVRLPAEGTAPLVVPLAVVYADLYAALQAADGIDELPVGLSGELGFDDLPFAVPFSATATIPAPRAPSIALRGFRVPRIDLLGLEADVAVDLGVSNPHGSEVYFDQLQFAVALGGADVGSGVVDGFGVEGATEELVTLLVTVSGFAVAGVLADALAGVPAPVVVRGDVGVLTPFVAAPLPLHFETEAILLPTP